MEKIRTLFQRDEATRKVIDHLDIAPVALNGAIATEKLDGTNIRLTVRAGEVVRVEKRRNPTKEQKTAGIIDPWYVEAEADAPGDKHIIRASESVIDLDQIPDGEWPAEAIGPGIQGNPLELDYPIAVAFSVPTILRALIVPDVEIDYAKIEWRLTADPETTSAFNDQRPIEGIVWWVCDDHDCHPVAKIKAKDFPASAAVRSTVPEPTKGA